MRWSGMAALAAVLLAPVALSAQGSGVMGHWKAPSGDVIRVDRCGASVCFWIVYLSPTAPDTRDVHNPDAGKRGRGLCGLKIGDGFSLRDADHAAGGALYDPKSGKTYSGQMTAEGSELHLRGYVLLSLFGRSETWTRAPEPANACKAEGIGN